MKSMRRGITDREADYQEDKSMNLKQVTSIYFSPTESTRHVVELIAEQIHGNRESLDLTDAVKTRPDYGFTENEAVLVGVPVYGGRVPETAVRRLKRLHGHNTPAVLVVTYGNRAYEDALAELDDSVGKQGFRHLSSAALTAQHSIVTQLASGRPDEEDAEEIRRFANEILMKYERILSGSEQPDGYPVPGNRPYKSWKPMQAVPEVTAACVRCGLCARRCPVEAIPAKEPSRTDPTKCFLCMRCVAICPEKQGSCRNRLWPAWNRSWPLSWKSAGKMNGIYKEECSMDHT